MRRLLLPACFALAACSRTPRPTEHPAGGAAETVRITQFYAEPLVAKGEKTNLCYGVENAKTVRIQPEVDKPWPAIARCFPVAPAQTTTYTLTAEDGSGHSVSQSVEVRVGPPKAKIIEVSVNKLEVKAGELVTVCYKAANATAVDAGPGKFVTPRGMDRGCFTDNPRRTTTYHVQITGAGGSADSEKVTVKVLP